MDEILVIGGYGDVGKGAVDELLKITNSSIVIGGRSEEKGAVFLRNIKNPRITFQRIDIYDKESYADKLTNISLAVMCLGPKNIDFAAYCLETGIHYVDISASHQTMKALRDLPLAKIRGTGVLGVGICPGLSTLLVKELATSVDEVIQTEVSLLLGMEDEYGRDALEWMLDNLVYPFYWKIEGSLKKQRPFIEKRWIPFRKGENLQSAYAFNLADQQIITNTMRQSNVSTFLSFDDSFMLSTLHLLAKARFFHLLKYRNLYDAVLNLGSNSALSSKNASSAFSVHVKIKGKKGNQIVQLEEVLHGKNSSEDTGRIAAYTASKVLEMKKKTGVYYLNEQFTLEDFSAYFEKETRERVTPM